MNAYFDSSALIRLYVLEDFTADLAAYVSRRGQPIAINWLHELEMENGLRSKVFRREMSDSLCRRIIDRIRWDIKEGLLVLQPVVWHEVFQDACRLSSEITVCSGCRSLDLLHIALARHWNAAIFVSFDDRQVKAAKMARLKVKAF